MESDGEYHESVSANSGPSASCAVLNTAMTKEAALFATQGGSQPTNPGAGREREPQPSIATDGTQRAETPGASHGCSNQPTHQPPAASASAGQLRRPAMGQPEQHSRQPQQLSATEVTAFEGAQAAESDLLQLEAHSAAALDRLYSALLAYPTGRIATQQDKALMQLLLEQRVEAAHIVEVVARLQHPADVAATREGLQARLFTTDDAVGTPAHVARIVDYLDSLIPAPPASVDSSYSPWEPTTPFYATGARAAAKQIAEAGPSTAAAPTPLVWMPGAASFSARQPQKMARQTAADVAAAAATAAAVGRDKSRAAVPSGPHLGEPRRRTIFEQSSSDSGPEEAAADRAARAAAAKVADLWDSQSAVEFLAFARDNSANIAEVAAQLERVYTQLRAASAKQLRRLFKAVVQHAGSVGEYREVHAILYDEVTRVSKELTQGAAAAAQPARTAAQAAQQARAEQASSAQLAAAPAAAVQATPGLFTAARAADVSPAQTAGQTALPAPAQQMVREQMADTPAASPRATPSLFGNAFGRVFDRGAIVSYQMPSGELVAAHVIEVHHANPPQYTVVAEGSQHQTLGDRLRPIDFRPIDAAHAFEQWPLDAQAEFQLPPSVAPRCNAADGATPQHSASSCRAAQREQLVRQEAERLLIEAGVAPTWRRRGPTTDATDMAAPTPAQPAMTANTTGLVTPGPVDNLAGRLAATSAQVSSAHPEVQRAYAEQLQEAAARTKLGGAYAEQLQELSLIHI